MKDIFISHSSNDKEQVRVLVGILRNKGVSVWLDDDDLNLGDNLVKEIQKGIEESSYLAIWVTKDALISGWVEEEWTSKYASDISSGIFKVIVCLAEDCEDFLPPFLRNKVHGRFYKDFDQALDKLVKKVKGKETNKPSQKFTIKIKSYVNHLLKSEINLPLHDTPIKIVTTLKSLPRSGKKLRFLDNEIKLPSRSIYDHILSIAHSADCFWTIVTHNMGDAEANDLASMLAYHDVCEVLLGDVPTHTHLNHDKKTIAQIIGVNRYGNLPEGSASPESITNDFIYMFLSPSARNAMLNMEKAMKTKDMPAYRFFYLLDKLDPIIAIWRYMYVFKKEINDIEQFFLDAVEDFFTNPEVMIIAKDFIEDTRFVSLVATLQDREVASEYIQNNKFWSSFETLKFGFTSDVIKFLIEGRGFEYPNSELALYKDIKAGKKRD